MENEEPSTLQSHKHEPPGKTVKQRFLGDTAAQRAAERGGKTHKHTKLFPRLGEGAARLTGFGSAILQRSP